MNKGGAGAPRKERATMPIGCEVVDQSVRTCDAGFPSPRSHAMNRNKMEVCHDDVDDALIKINCQAKSHKIINSTSAAAAPST